MEVAGIDEEAEAFRWRRHVPEEARQLGDGLPQLAALARVLEEQARAGGRTLQQLAELARRDRERPFRARMALGVADVEARPGEPTGNLRQRRIDGEADAHRDHCTAFESNPGRRRPRNFPLDSCAASP